jgi:hypothetical protein
MISHLGLNSMEGSSSRPTSMPLIAFQSSTSIPVETRLRARAVLSGRFGLKNGLPPDTWLSGCLNYEVVRISPARLGSKGNFLAGLCIWPGGTIGSGLLPTAGCSRYNFRTRFAARLCPLLAAIIRSIKGRSKETNSYLVFR